MIRYEIHHLNGEPWLSNIGDYMHRWQWISETMAGIYECDPGDVEVMETEAHGDVLIVLGKAVGLLPAPRTGSAATYLQTAELADKFMLSVCECEDDPAKVMDAVKLWRVARTSAKKREEIAA